MENQFSINLIQENVESIRDKEKVNNYFEFEASEITHEVLMEYNYLVKSNALLQKFFDLQFLFSRNLNSLI